MKEKGHHIEKEYQSPNIAKYSTNPKFNTGKLQAFVDLLYPNAEQISFNLLFDVHI